MKAFPRPIGEMKTVGAGKWSDSQSGMDLRDYFAAKAMQGLLASYGHHDVAEASEFAHDAYRLADAMMQARKPEEQK